MIQTKQRYITITGPTATFDFTKSFEKPIECEEQSFRISASNGLFKAYMKKYKSFHFNGNRSCQMKHKSSFFLRFEKAFSVYYENVFLNMQPSYMELQVAEEDDYYKLILIYKYDRPVGAGNWSDINNTDLVLIVFQLLPQPYGRGVFWPLSFYPVHPRLLDNLIWSRNEFVKDKDEILPNLTSYRGEMNGADDGSNICFGGDADEMTRRGYPISQLYMRATRKEVLENNVSPAFNDSFNCMHL